MRTGYRSILLTAAAVAILPGQQTIAPTTEPVGSARGDNLGTYNIQNSVETGYRFSLIDGNLGKYRSDVNYRNGLRLLGSSLLIQSREGNGKYFDRISLTTLGLGNDPYQSAMLRVEKNRLYRYDMLWRYNEYFNPGLAIAGGQHWYDTGRRLQDHDLVLLPQSSFSLNLGYSRENQTGPALSTMQLFDGRGDVFPIFRDVRRTRNEFRLGGRFRVAGFKVDWLHAWDNFREDTPSYLSGPEGPATGSSAGNNPADPTTLSTFRRFEPYHGNTPLWRVNLRREARWFALNGRFTYAGGRRNFTLDELAIGTDRFGAQNRQVVVTGSARRPVATGNLLVSFTPGSKVTVTNETSFYNNRIDGTASYIEFNNATAGVNVLNFQFLGIRTAANTTLAVLQATSWLALRGGYQYSSRRIVSVEASALAGDTLETPRNEQENHLHSAIAGIRLQPLKPLMVNLDAEVGRADRPFYPVSEKDYHVLGGRAQYRTRTITLYTSYRQRYNTNSVALGTHSARGRDYSAGASWSPRGRFGLDATYSKMHLDTLSGLAYFVRSQLTPGTSVYVSNLHTGTLGVRHGFWRADLFAGYSIVQDAGDSRGVRFFDPLAILSGTPQVFPLRYHTPMARVSLRLREKLRWNFGWQFYRYREEFSYTPVSQNYRAHTGYSSVLWSF
jgi:hypothetical protein